jgi:hypothetical protein
VICWANVTHAPNESSLTCNPDFPSRRYFIKNAYHFIRSGSSALSSSAKPKDPVEKRDEIYRAGGIRTRDLLNPIQAHYQAVLRPADAALFTARVTIAKKFSELVSRTDHSS